MIVLRTLWRKSNTRLAIAIILTCFQFRLFAQENKQDTTASNRDIFHILIDAAHRNSRESRVNDQVLNGKSELPFLPFEGKIIRHIILKEFGFEKNFNDTTVESRPLGVKLLNALHRNTREWVIRDNLFIRENHPLNPEVVADNERYLRSLDFIQDTRILVEPLPGIKDSVDLVIITKDLFSITGDLYDANPNRFKAMAGDVNVAGMGQTFFFTSLLEKNRLPAFGYEAFYSKNSIANTFINGSAGFTTIQQDLSKAGLEDEKQWQLEFTRPLVSQYLHFAGGILFSHHGAHNTYRLPDSLFYQYHYNAFDCWTGYNLGIKRLIADRLKSKKFVSIRYFKNKFSQTPYQVDGHYSFRYDNRQALLARLTLFRQRFYKTNYVYGFGATEDFPYGYNLAFTTGWYQQADLKRFYAGIDANKYIVTNSAFFIQYFLRAGTFFRHGKMEDGNLLVGSSLYSKLFLHHSLKIRQYISISAARQFNRLGLEELTINNPFGVRYFRSDSALGNERISLYSETFLFLNRSLLGFKFSPFAFGNISFLKPEEASFSKSNAYYGLGGGFRMRNENLVFGTIEVRFAYFPRKIDQNSFKLTLSANLGFKFNSSYVKEPDIIDVNNNVANEIY